MRRTGQGLFTAHGPGYQVWCFLFLLQGWFINITFFCSRENGQWKVGKRPPCHEDATGAVHPCPPPIPRWQHPTPQLEWPPRRSLCPACDTPHRDGHRSSMAEVTQHHSTLRAVSNPGRKGLKLGSRVSPAVFVTESFENVRTISNTGWLLAFRREKYPRFLLPDG